MVYFSGLPCSRYLAVAVFIIAAFTDYLDGHIARKYHLITNLGKVLDPLGDKLFTFAALICIAVDGMIPFWVAALFFLKEALMGFGGILIYKKIEEEMPPSNLLGKTAAVLFFISCLALMLWENIPKLVVITAISIAFAVSLSAFISYFITLIGIVKRKKGEAPE